MEKYIDADLLKKYLKELQENYQFVTYEGLYYLIEHLQQEQPEADGDDGKFVKILVRKEFAEQFKKLGAEIQAGQSSFIQAMNQQEVDLEKEIDNFLNETGAPYVWCNDDEQKESGAT